MRIPPEMINLDTLKWKINTVLDDQKRQTTKLNIEILYRTHDSWACMFANQKRLSRHWENYIMQNPTSPTGKITETSIEKTMISNITGKTRLDNNIDLLFGNDGFIIIDNTSRFFKTYMGLYNYNLELLSDFKKSEKLFWNNKSAGIITVPGGTLNNAVTNILQYVPQNNKLSNANELHNFIICEMAQCRDSKTK